MLTGADLGTIAADCGTRLLVIADEYANSVDMIVAASSDLGTVIAVGKDTSKFSTGQVDFRLWSSVSDHSEAPAAATSKDASAFWLYSSGTTGLPKGVIHRHGDLQATFDTYASKVLNITSEDRCLSVAKLFFAYGLGNSLTFPLAAGACAILERRYGDELARVFADAEHGRVLADDGFADDLTICGTLDAFPVLPIYQDRQITKLGPERER